MTITHDRTITTLSVTVAILVSAAAIFFSGARSSLAPEAARLNNTLYTNTSATYMDSNAATTAYFLSATNWTYAPSLPVGAPCSTTRALPAGTVIYSVLQGSGSYRKCQ